MTQKLTERPQQRKHWTLLLKEAVRFFHTQTGMRYEAIGLAAIRNARFWNRLETGGTITLRKADQVYDWMEKQGYYFNPEGDCYVEQRS